jgi:tetratricopeptide (TPR) repeat protein
MMSQLRTLRRVLLLGLGLLSACAAADPGSDPVYFDPAAGAHAHGGFTGIYGSYLLGRFADSESDPDMAARAFLRTLQADPTDHEVLQNAFIATLLSDRPEAESLARQLPENQEAQLLLGGIEARAGQWTEAEQRFRAMPRQGLTQLLQPLLLAWAEQGGGHTDTALATLRPLVEGQRFRGIYALHAALIADQAGRVPEATRFYRIAENEFSATNLRLTQILASWLTRQGHAADAERGLSALSDGQDELSLVVPALVAAGRNPPVANPTQGIAEAYLALGAALRQQDASDYALIMLNLALNLRPDLSAARLLMADIHDVAHQPQAALDALAPIPDSDPLSGIVRLHRAQLQQRLDHTDQAIDALSALARDYPKNPLPDVQMGDILRGKKRFQAAIAAYDGAVAKLKGPRRSGWPLFYSRGIAHEQAHEWPEAEADLQRALALAPDQPYVLNYLGYTWADQGIRLPEARRMIERALEQTPNDGAIVDSLGWIMIRQGQTAEAVPMLERAVGLQSEDATINQHLGDAYWAVGRRLEAVFQWRRALTLNPEPEDQAALEKKLRDADSQLAQPGPVSTTAAAQHAP